MGLKGRFLAILFLLLNSVCTDASFLKLSGENYKEPVSIGSAQIPMPVENEEEKHATSSVYTNHINSLSLRKQCCKGIHHEVAGRVATSGFAIDLPDFYLNDACVLPLPGYYSFLFRYNLF